MAFCEAPESSRTRHDFIPEVLRDPFVRVAMQPAVSRVQMPPSPDATTSPPPTSPISIHSSEGGLKISSFPPIRRLTNEFLMPAHITRSLSPSPVGEQVLSEWGYANRMAISMIMSHQVPVPRECSHQEDEDVEELQADPHTKSSKLLYNRYIPKRNTTVEWFQQEAANGTMNHLAWREQQPPSGFVLRYGYPEGYGLPLPEANIQEQLQDKEDLKEAVDEDSADGSEEEIELNWRIPVRRDVRSQPLSPIERSTSATRLALAAMGSIWQPFFHEM